MTLSAVAAQPGTIADDRSHRNTAIHWPGDFEPATAPVFSNNEIFIHADCHRVWTQLTDITAWPDWFLLVKDVTIDGPSKAVQHATLVHLKIFGSPITTRIDEFVPRLPPQLDSQGPRRTAPKTITPRTSSPNPAAAMSSPKRQASARTTSRPGVRQQDHAPRP